ncbi:MAG: aminoacyl-tRNA hydrolase [Rickettsiales bacterium]|nr:aminoacyl-tRNA hydrolase [Rickettsiales bacterium]
MHLIVGLGNPGSKYENTRHNVGFQVIDAITTKFKIPETGSKFNAILHKGVIETTPVTLIKPQTFMNDSGKSVSQFINFYKIPLKNVIVIYDDLDMFIGKLRVRSGGSDGGHNGIKSINSLVSNEYIKVKIGIAHPGHKDLVSKYVLEPFKEKEEIDTINELYADIAQNISILLQGDLDHFSSLINNKRD